MVKDYVEEGELSRMSLDKYYRRYADDLLAQGLSDAQVAELLEAAAWIEEKADSREYFDRSVASDALISAVSESVSSADSADEVQPRKFAVLLTTGSLDPIHNGHVEMMSRARQTAQDKGYTVLAGVVSTGHDDYVRKQKNGAGEVALSRVQNTQRFLDQHKENASGWLICDSWESMIAPGAVNFTTVIDWVKRQTRYAAPEYSAEITVLYVFGADNSTFAHPLVDQAHALPVVVQREGWEMPTEVTDYVRQGKALYAESDNTLSSTVIRQANLHNHPYVIRRDALAASSYLSGVMGAQRHRQKAGDFGVGLVNAFREVFGTEVSIVGIDIQEQIRSTAEYLSANFDSYTRFISADKYLRGERISQIQCSRVFDVGTEQQRSHRLEVEALENYQGEPCVFIDDDIATGYTVDEVSKIYNVVSTVSMLSVMIPYGIKDIVDERDFLVGARHGGLVCDSASGTIRFPYVFPYVDLTSRAKLPAEKVKAFSARIWELNENFYRGTGLRVADIENNDFMLAAEAAETDEIEKYCTRMKKLLGAG